MKKTPRITFNGKSYDVEAEIIGDDVQVATPRPAPVHASAPAPRAAPAYSPPPAAAPAPTSPAPSSGGPGDLPSPLAGKVVSIDAPEGTAVTAGQTVMTLEAMKMNTSVSAPTDGTVKKVLVQPGDGVEEGQTLMTIA